MSRTSSSSSKRPETRSGYPVKDVLAAMETAIESRDAERACCLAAELAVSDQHPVLMDCLVDLFAQWYVSMDVLSLRRVHAAFGTAARGLAQGGLEARRALCELVISMSLGLPRQNALEHVARRVGGEGCGKAKGCPPEEVVARTMQMYPMMVRGSGDEAIQAMCGIFSACAVKSRVPAGTVSLVFQGFWETCKSCCAGGAGREDWRMDYIRMARDLFYVMDDKVMPTRGRCMSRRNLVVCAILVANSILSGIDKVPLPRSSWDASRAESAISRSIESLDSIFEETKKPTPHPGSPSTSCSAAAPISYLQCYTIRTETAAPSAAPQLPSAAPQLPSSAAAYEKTILINEGSSSSRRRDATRVSRKSKT